MRKKKFIISKVMWRRLEQKLDNLASQLVHIEKLIPNKSKRWLKFEECIPPADVCKSIISMMDGTKFYIGLVGKLAEYYGCEPMELTVDKTRILALEQQTGKKYNAIYDKTVKTAFSREETIDRKTVLHEWFHHLHAQNVVFIDRNKEEEYAEQYAEIFLKRANNI